MYIHHISFTHSSIDRHLGCSHALAMVNNAAINIGVQTPLQDSNVISIKYGSSIFNFGEKRHTAFPSGYTNIHSYQQCLGFPFLIFLSTLISYPLNNSYSNRGEVIAHCDFDLQLPDDFSDVDGTPFHIPTGYLYVLFGKMSIQDLCPFF